MKTWMPCAVSGLLAWSAVGGWLPAQDDPPAGDGPTVEARQSPDAPPDAKAGAVDADSLDAELLDSLGDDGLDLPDEPKAPAEGKSAPRTAGDGDGDGEQVGPPDDAAPDLDDELLRDLDDGEDFGEAPEDPLLRLGQRMREAESLISRQQSGQETQELQRKIVDDLDELIKQALKKQQQAQSSQSKNQQQKTAQRQQIKQPQPGPDAGKPQDGQANQPASDSSDQLRPDESARPDPRMMEDLVKKSWGNLPAREREQMLQLLGEDFLPGYESLIEEYFKALVERQQESP
jgi:hypothetical protein